MKSRGRLSHVSKGREAKRISVRPLSGRSDAYNVDTD